jgi:hypothetical protein
MIELYTIKELNRLNLFGSVCEGKRFVSVYSKEVNDKGGSWDDFWETKSYRIEREIPKFGYKIVKEYSKALPEGMLVAYTLDNEYIGDPKIAKYLCEKRGIKPEIKEGCNVCSIGKCIYKDKDHEDYDKWFGWSHRAIFGFKVGDGYKVKKGDCLEGYFPIGFEAKTEEDCKKMASAFSDSVS